MINNQSKKRFRRTTAALLSAAAVAGAGLTTASPTLAYPGNPGSPAQIPTNPG
jgi:hypothetical protein